MGLLSLNMFLINKSYENNTDPRPLNIWLMKIQKIESIEYFKTKFLCPYLFSLLFPSVSSSLSSPFPFLPGPC